MRYHHVDVFAPTPLAGNGLTVVFPERPLSDDVLMGITREFNQFETIFVSPADGRGAYPARIFTTDEELAFAGHPVLGAGAVLHHLFFPAQGEAEIRLALGGESERLAPVRSRREGGRYRVTMNQGRAAFLGTADASRAGDVAAALRLTTEDLDAGLPMEIVSTGLSYLLVPVRRGLAGCGIARDDFAAFLSGFGAQFAYVFDTATLECRTWDNAGLREDVATGSAAGPLSAYLVRHGVRGREEDIRIHQGRFAGRPSVLTGRVSGEEEVFLSGDVALFASGVIEADFS